MEHKSPTAELTFSLDWSAWLPEGDTITGSTWQAEAGISVMSEDVSDTQTAVKLAGGQAGKTYKITNTITTGAGALVAPRSFFVRVKEQIA